MTIWEKLEKERQQQYAIINGERPSLDTEEKICDKLRALQKNSWLYYKVFVYYEELCKKLGR